jgi:hypothetical protein
MDDSIEWIDRALALNGYYHVPLKEDASECPMCKRTFFYKDDDKRYCQFCTLPVNALNRFTGQAQNFAGLHKLIDLLSHQVHSSKRQNLDQQKEIKRLDSIVTEQTKALSDIATFHKTVAIGLETLLKRSVEPSTQ